MSESQADICIIGAGAAGLAAAVFAGEVASSRPQTIVLLDGAKTLGAKILVSGGGRCNVTHETVTAQDYFGNRRIIKNVLAALSVKDTVAWFESIGVNLKREDTGKLFPVTDKSRTVLNALLERCRRLGVNIHPDHRVTDIAHSPDTGFIIRHSQGTLHGKKLILATGGRSLPKSGSDGSGFELAKRFGHHVTATVPALVPFVLDDGMFHKTLSGLSQEVELTTVVNGKTVDQRTGSLLWTHFGISGPVVMDASRFWTLAKERVETAHIYGNFLPGLTAEQVREWILKQAQEHPRRSLVKTLALRLPERFADAAIFYAGCDKHMASGQLPRNNREHLLALLTQFPFPVRQDRGWNYAEVTAGGIPLEEVNYRTMESKVVPGLYLAGEILDCDGRIGGFNFQWAWATGLLAGRAAADSRLHAEPREA